MKPRTIAMAGGAVLLIAAGVVFVPRSKEAPTPGDTARTEQSAPQSAKIEDRGSATPSKPDAGTAPKQPALTDEERATILNEIEQSSVTYDAKALPSIEPYLLHPDPEVRQAAMNGMIVLGDAAAGPLLRNAAGKAPNPKEAVALGEAADYIELPSGTFVPKERTAPGTRLPKEAKGPESRRPKSPPASPAKGE